MKFDSTIIASLIAAFSAVIGYLGRLFFERKKNKAETRKIEADVEFDYAKGFKDLSKSQAETISEMSQQLQENISKVSALIVQTARFESELETERIKTNQALSMIDELKKENSHLGQRIQELEEENQHLVTKINALKNK